MLTCSAKAYRAEESHEGSKVTGGRGTNSKATLTSFTRYQISRLIDEEARLSRRGIRMPELEMMLQAYGSMGGMFICDIYE